MQVFFVDIDFFFKHSHFVAHLSKTSIFPKSQLVVSIGSLPCRGVSSPGTKYDRSDIFWSNSMTSSGQDFNASFMNNFGTKSLEQKISLTKNSANFKILYQFWYFDHYAVLYK